MSLFTSFFWNNIIYPTV